VREVHDGLLGAGVHEVRWDGRGETGVAVRPGVYLVRARNLDRGTLLATKLTVLR